MPIERGIAGVPKFGRRSASFFTLNSQDADATYSDSADSNRTVYQFTTDGSISITVQEDTCSHTKTSRDLRLRGFRGVDPGSFLGASNAVDYIVAGGGAGGGQGSQTLGGGGGGAGAVRGYWPTVFPGPIQEPSNISFGAGAASARFRTGVEDTTFSMTIDVGGGGSGAQNGSSSSLTFPAPVRSKYSISDISCEGGGPGGAGPTGGGGRPQASGGGAGGNSNQNGGPGGPHGNPGGNARPTNGYHSSDGGGGAGGGGRNAAGTQTPTDGSGPGGGGIPITVPTRPGSTTFGIGGGGGGGGRPGISGPTHGNRWPSRGNGGAGPNGGGTGNSNAPSSNNYGGGGGGGNNQSGRSGAQGIVLVVF